MEYPKENIVILCHLKDGRRTKGFFYMNGTKPTFAAYGSEITDKVIGWEYIRPRQCTPERERSQVREKGYE